MLDPNAESLLAYVRLVGGHLSGKSLLTWLSLLMSLAVSYLMLPYFPRDVLNEVWD